MRPAARLLLAAGALAAAACARSPKWEEAGVPALPADADPLVELLGARVEPAGCGGAGPGCTVVVEYRLTDRGAAITGADATALAPTWTLAWLGTEPVSGLPAWASLLLTGSQTAARLPPAGFGTPAGQVLLGQKQPGRETGGVTTELGDGRFTYAFKDALPGTFSLSSTIRVGVYLGGAAGTPTTNATHDFTPDGSPVGSYDTATVERCDAGGACVRVERCADCHGVVSAHGGRRVGVRMCVTCHTWQAVDPDTMDPTAMAPSTKATFPNSVEFGRMIHRIHRGKKLPTLFLSSSAATWPAMPFTGTPPLPYLNGRNAVAPSGTKYAIVGFQGQEHVYGRVATRIENFQPARTLAEGIGYPQDLRNCDACHDPSAPEYAAIGNSASTAVSISRRTCSGCHPDVFYGDPDDAARTTPDATHFSHTGGRLVDDAACKDCHVVARSGGPKLYAPISEIHRPLNDLSPSGSPRWSRVTGEIVGVTNMLPGQAPTISFKLRDRRGTISPLNTTATEDAALPNASPVPRGLTPAFILAGPTTDYLNGNVALRAAPAATLAADANDVFTFTSAVPLPATASGVWAIGMEGRRRVTSTFYTLATDSFGWPFTGEQVTEWMTSPIAFVDTSSSDPLKAGTVTSDPKVARRSVVDQGRCARCHLELNLHGGNRHDVEHCLLCHTPDATDWDKRPRDTRATVGTGQVLLNDPVPGEPTTVGAGNATLDGIEERSIHFKVMVHRIHTGEREGAASLEGIRPYVVYGFRSSATAAPSPFFFDDVRYPRDLANCEACHKAGTWMIEGIPASAQPTTANERGTILHAAAFNSDGSVKTAASAAHTSTSEPKLLPITAACTSCHTSGAAVDHAAGKTTSGSETCVSCHGEGGAQSVRRVHAVP